MRALTHFPTFQHFIKIYGEEPHLGCYLVACERPQAEPWQLKMIIDGNQLREASIAVASKRQLYIWCRKSLKLQRWNMRLIIGEKGISI